MALNLGAVLDKIYDPFGRKILEKQPIPIGGWTSYSYNNFGNPYGQYIMKTGHITGGVYTLDHYTSTYFDGMGRTYWVGSTGPAGKTIVTETFFDSLGRVSTKSNPYFYGETRYDTTSTYDGLSRVTQVEIPDYPTNRFIRTTYQGLKKIVTNQRNHSTAFTYDVYQRLKKVEDPYGTATEYSYDTLGNLTSVIAAKDATEQNTTTMTYDSLSKKRWMTDPDMGPWEFRYDKSGNLTYQKNAKSQTITFSYDDLNRLRHKYYPDSSMVTYTYDETSLTNCMGQIISVPYSIGKLTRVNYAPTGQDASEDAILSFDVMQRVTSSQKKIGSETANCVAFNKTYDSAGRVVSITYPGNKTYSYEYDVAGNLLYLKDNATSIKMAEYSNFTALGQPKSKTFPKTGGVVQTTYEYYPETGRLKKLFTEGLTITGTALNNMTHNYTYDALNRLETAKGNNGSAYDHTGTNSYQYDRIGNITYKPDVGSYSYNYSIKPHAVNSTTGAMNITLQYDSNGNMTSRTGGGRNLGITYNYDNMSTLITNYGSNSLQFTYDGNGQRVKKYIYSTGVTVLYFGSEYEKRGSVGIIHLFAGNQRVVSVGTDGITQFYHPDHLGSSWIITDSNGAIKEKNEFYPFGTYLESFNSYPSFPPVNYTFTGQEEDEEVGLYNYNARLYDPVLGKFISPDIIVPDPEDPQSLNHYSYVRNNPLKYIDPTGNFDIGGEIGGIFSDIGADIVAFFSGLLGFSSDSNSNSSFLEFSSGSSSNSVKGPTFDIIMPNLVDDAKLFLMSLSFKAPSQLSYNTSKEDTSGRLSLQIDLSKAFEVNNQYVDLNFSFGFPFFLGFTGGIMWNMEKISPYLGGGIVTPGLGGSLTWSPNGISPGISVALQLAGILAGQGGYSFGKGSTSGSWFLEIGMGGSLPTVSGGSLTGYYAFGPYSFEAIDKALGLNPSRR